jgi:hypothetical protein
LAENIHMQQAYAVASRFSTRGIYWERNSCFSPYASRFLCYAFLKVHTHFLVVDRVALE